jgi:uncharacterized RDD family membrane protein YckC
MARWRDVKHGRIQKSPKKEPAAPQTHYAPVSARLKAFLTDTFMITMPILYIVIYFVMGSREEFRANMAQGWLYIIIPHYLIVTLLWTIKGQTPGMKAYGITLRRWPGLDKNPDFLRSTIRYFAMPVSIVSIVGLLVAFFRADRATFHDLISFSRMVVVEDF